MKTSTGNLLSHLRDKHKIVLENKLTDKSQRKVTDMLLSVASSSPASTQSSSNRIDKDRYILARQMCLWFCRDLIPFYEANKVGIHDFFVWAGIIKADENVPDRKTLANAALNDIYTALLKLIHKYVESAVPNMFSISFDFWTDNVKRVSYITYWIHWMSPEFKMEKMCLRVVSFPHPHNGELIKQAFNQLMADFKLTEKRRLAVTDNGSNLIKACKLLELEREPCICHNLHLLVSVDLIKNHPCMQPIRDLIVRMKTIYKKLVYKYEQLKKMNDDDYNRRLYDVISSLENICE